MISAEGLKEIDRAIAKYPADQKQSAVMSALAIAQEEHGWLSPELDAVRRGLSRHAGDRRAGGGDLLHDVRTSPVGKYKITLCTNLPCQLGPDGGSDSAAEYLKQKLGIDFGETTADGKFTLKEGECMGACGDAPVMLVNNHRMCSFMSRDEDRPADRGTFESDVFTRSPHIKAADSRRPERR